MLRTVVGIAIALLVLAGATTVLGGQTDRAEFNLGLTKNPGAATAVKLHVLLKHPDDPEAKPPPLTGGEIRLPAGMRVDTGAVPQCEATDQEIETQGRAACPEESQVGAGTLLVMMGLPGDPREFDLIPFNGDGQLIEVVFFKGTNAVAAIDRVTVEDGKLVPHPPARPGGPPDGQSAVRELRLELPRRVGEQGRAYATAPPECATGEWRSSATFEFADGAETTVPYATPCDRPRAALNVAVRPGRAQAGERTRFRIRLTSDDRRCIRRARVRVGGKRARTNVRGRARVTATFARPGQKAVVAKKRGCAPGRAAIDVS